MNKPSVLTGALIGGLVTVPFIMLSALANQLLGLPFAPFDLFPAIRDILPGFLLTFTIDTMVDTIIALNLGRVDEAAKIAEQGMAAGMLLVIGIIAGLLFVFIMNQIEDASGKIGGLIMGLGFGVVMALISAELGLSATIDSDAASAAWLIGSFTLWGLVIGYAYDVLRGGETTTLSTAKTGTA